MIEINNVSIAFGKREILKDLNISFKKGKFSAIVGPNGCGKTTIIKIIANLLKQDSGQNIIDGKDKNDFNKKELARKIAFLMQFKDVNHDFSVRETITYGRQPHLKSFAGLSEYDQEVIDWAIAKTNLQNLENTPVNILSGGEKQRVFLALALAQEPDVLILDEPTNHLDLKYQFEILNLVKELNIEKKLTIICVLHDLNHAMRFADEIIVMKDGQFICKGDANNCINAQLVNQVYGVNCELYSHNNKQYIEVI